MSEDDRTFKIRRILVALDASPHSMAALAAAVELAARLEAELLGLFVEDVELLRLADSPYARELLYPLATEAPLNRASMESKLRAQSEQARQALAAAAKHSQVRWSFRTVRGDVASEVLAAATEADLLAMGKLGWSFGTQFRMGSTALQIAAGTTPVLLLSEHGMPPDVQPVVYYDASPAAKRGLLAAAELAKRGTKTLTLLLAAADQDDALTMRERVNAVLEGKNIEVRYRQIDPQDEVSLLRALKRERPGVLVFGGRELLKKLQPLEELLRETEMALLLLGDAEEPEAK